MVVNGLNMRVVVCHVEDMDEAVSTSTAHELQSCGYSDKGHNTTSSLSDWCSPSCSGEYSIHRTSAM